MVAPARTTKAKEALKILFSSSSTLLLPLPSPYFPVMARGPSAIDAPTAISVEDHPMNQILLKGKPATLSRYMGFPQMPINQVIGDQDALSQSLPFAMRLASFIKTRPKNVRFAFGHWLTTIDNVDYEKLREAYRIFITTDVRDVQNAPIRNDMLTLLMTAIIAESGKRTMNVHSKKMPGHIDSMGVAITIESWRRNGLVKLDDDIRILQRKPCGVEVTDLMRIEDPATYDLLMQNKK